MNEILIRKHVKKVMAYGINKRMAQDIVETAIETGKGKNIEMFIKYAITLTYGITISEKVSVSSH
ncbi:hypothetical protein PQE70_gp016 [Bacillus phage vB_BanS_Nate]|uniref:Uncharacterized protein n=1 Tax=Bacillus phage vB_BanS_Nate TaxID=2894788 RepID=A0AAE8YXJ5_9CAUD|nr:hypothetical protein PQE70_gp016 [Bacillus phage vB_BanS_Nate]UGO50869.1 hypothetical protein NATE_16 [Bacillus phage vB_BanS_Nate]